MGWTSVNYREATHTTLTGKQALAFLRREYSQFEFAAFHFVGAKDKYSHNECYMILKHYQKQTPFILCTIIDIKNGEIYWKEIEESSAPAYYNCPEKFFQFVPAPNTYAVQWRKECKRSNAKFKPILEFS